MIVFRPTYKDKATGETRSTSVYYLRHRSKRYTLNTSDRAIAERKARALIESLELGFSPTALAAAQKCEVLSLVEEYLLIRR